MSSDFNHDPYVPQGFSEIYDMIGGMVLSAPKYNRSDEYGEQNIDTEFSRLDQSFETVRKKLGEEDYSRLLALSARAKALFLADPDVTNGKAHQGWDALQEIEGIIQEVRRARYKAKLKDEDGNVTGD